MMMSVPETFVRMEEHVIIRLEASIVHVHLDGLVQHAILVSKTV